MVLVVGLEPTRRGHQFLRLARLPVPPHQHNRLYQNISNTTVSPQQRPYYSNEYPIRMISHSIAFRTFRYRFAAGALTPVSRCRVEPVLAPIHQSDYLNAAMLIELVGITRFEHATLWSQTRCSTKLSYIPIIKTKSHSRKIILSYLI